MATKLNHPLKREVMVGGKPHTLTIDTDGFKLVPKGKRKGLELAWRDLVSGEAALAVALNVSLAGRSVRRPKEVGPPPSRPSGTDVRAWGGATHKVAGARATRRSRP